MNSRNHSATDGSSSMYVSPTVSCAMSLREVLCALRSSEKVGRYFIVLLLTSVIMCADATRLPEKNCDLELVGACTPSQSDVTRMRVVVVASGQTRYANLAGGGINTMTKLFAERKEEITRL